MNLKFLAISVTLENLVFLDFEISNEDLLNIGRMEVAEFTSLKGPIDALRMMTIIGRLNK